jgi:predicted sugar kinase
VLAANGQPSALLVLIMADFSQTTVAPHNALRVLRLALPDEWRFLVVRPINTQGLSGAAEQQWFQGRREMPAALTNYLASLIQQRLLPAVANADAAGFASALETYGDSVGGFYAPAQGGTFSHPSISRLVAGLRQQGIHGGLRSLPGARNLYPRCLRVSRQTDS